MRRLLSPLLVVAVALGAAACGGSDDEGNATGDDSITKAEFVEQANAICAEGDEVAEGFEEPTSQEEFVALLLDEVLPNIRAQIADIRALGFPEGDEQRIARPLDDSDDIIDQIEASPEEFVTDVDPFVDVNEEFDSYGLTECGSE